MPVYFSKSLVLGLLLVALTTQTVASKSKISISPSERAAAKGFVNYEQGKVSESVYWFKQAVKLGDPGAGYNLATMVLRGETSGLKPKQALAYLEISANRNFGLAQFLMGTLYEQGQWVAKSNTKAFDWFLRAANNQQSDAFFAVGNAYYLGAGTSQDYGKALSWYEKSANTGDVGAQYLVASMYETGLGTRVDLETAVNWYSLSARQGDIAAALKAKELAGKIADQQKSKP